MRKFAQARHDDEEDEDFSFNIGDDDHSPLPELELKKYLALMKALQNYYQHAHWISKGEPYYADHLLFERLYGSLGGQIDSLAEKMVGVGGDHFVCVKTVMSITNKILSHVPEMDRNTLGYEMVQTSLKLEKMFLSYTKKLYTKMKEDESLTLGFDDMLMSLYNEHEGNVYLLGQRIKRA
jgi:starvation-inducible DNA-binding protein